MIDPSDIVTHALEGLMTFTASYLWQWVRKLRRDVNEAFKKIRCLESQLQRWEDDDQI